jgi:hypothetical protein
MKATFEFNLPRELHEYDDHRRGPTFKAVLCDFHNWLRNQLKHETHTQDGYDALDKARDQFWEILNDHGVDIHD